MKNRRINYITLRIIERSLDRLINDKLTPMDALRDLREISYRTKIEMKRIYKMYEYRYKGATRKNR